MHATLLFLTLLSWLPLAACECKCRPDQSCWPSQHDWAQFNETLSGKLIRTSPVASPCYGGPSRDAAACAAVTNGWTSAAFQASQPLGYDYPLNESCPLAPFANNTPPSNCKLGSWPVYAVNVTTEDDIAKSIIFAKEKNLRLVVKSTGHDFLQRSTGSGSLSIWLHYFRGGFEFWDNNPEYNNCPATGWTGGTLTITGAYAWSDIYPTAQQKGVIVVGGNNEGPCSTGGWTQGGGHSPVTRYYGMGADQVLAARVVLASGTVVTANPCENQDLFYAIRGGGGGTYGVITQIRVKTYPTQKVHTLNLVVGSAGEATVPQFLDAMTTVYSSLPDLSTAGFAGYASWAAHSPTPLLGDYTNVLFQTFTMLGGTAKDASRLFHPFEDKLLGFNDSGDVEVTITRSSYPDYMAYFNAKSGTDAQVGAVSALASRLLDASALSGDLAQLRTAMDPFAGAQGKPVFHTVVHHGLQAASSSITPAVASAIQPGWYNSIILDIFERPLDGLDVVSNADIFADVRDNIEPVYRRLSPSTGTYMNEADWGDVHWQQDFFGANWQNLSWVKAKYDTDGLFYCPTCVGSEAWVMEQGGSLCRLT